MPRYFFDIYDNDNLFQDDYGIELESLYAARDQAIALLPDVARDVLPDGDHHTFKAVVKCRERRIRYVVSLTLDGAWIEPPTYPEGEPAPP